MIYVYPKLPSTNDEARRLAIDGATHGTTVLAYEQECGRGRQGRNFVSPAGGLYMSTVIADDCADTTILTLIAAVVVAHAIEEALNIRIGIKWVNDIIYRDLKVGGILTEKFSGGAIVGIGLNLHTAQLPDDIGDAGTMSDIALGVSVQGLAQSIQKKLIAYTFGAIDRQIILEEYRTRSILLGKAIEVTIGDSRFDATAIAIGDGGELIVNKDNNETVSLTYGEARVRKNT